MRLLVAVLLLAAAAGGFLLGRLTAPEEGGRGGPYRDGDVKASLEASIPFREGERPDPVMLMPGRYVVTAHAAGCEPGSTQFDVSDRIVEVTLALAPLR